jgi:hypothetical protein
MRLSTDRRQEPAARQALTETFHQTEALDCMTKTRSLDSALGPTGTQAGTPSVLLEFGIQDDGTLIRYEHFGRHFDYTAV